MERILKLFNSLVDERDRINEEEFDGKYSTIIDKIESKKLFRKYPNTQFIPIFQIANEIAEEELAKTCVSYDIDFVLKSDTIEKYKAKVADIDTTNPYLYSSEVDKLAGELTDELHESGNGLAHIVKSGTRGKPSNIFRSFISDGYKVNRVSEISNFIEESLFEGYQTIENEFKSSQTARNALIVNQGSVSASGYLARRANYITKYMNFVDDECDSTKTIKVTLTDSNRKRYMGRHFINPETDLLDVIQKDSPNGVYNIFTPLHCNIGNKNVCLKCYGANNLNISDFKDIGILSSTALTDKMTQLLLSTKHFVDIKFPKLNERIEYQFSEGKHQFVIKDSSEIIIDDEHANTIHILFNDGKEVTQILPIKDLVINGNIVSSLSDKLYNMDISFILPTINGIFNKTGKMKDTENVHDYYKEIIKFLDNVNIGIESVHIEMVLSAMTRNAKNPRLMATETPNEEYKIHSLSSSILNGSGKFDSLCFERIKETFANPMLFLDHENATIGFEQLFYNNGETDKNDN